LAELKILTENSDVKTYFQFQSSGNDKEVNRFCIYGYLLPRNKPYKHGSYKIRIILPLEFPLKSPQIQLLTYIYHPAIDKNISTPRFCTECCCGKWMPKNHINQWIERLVNVIDQPEASENYCVMNPAAKKLYARNTRRYGKKALAMVRKHSCPRSNQLTNSSTLSTFVSNLVLESGKLSYSPLPECLKPYSNSTMDQN
jgi:ubiquitin-protein ligase